MLALGRNRLAARLAARTFSDRRFGLLCRFRTGLGLGGFAEDFLLEQTILSFEMLDTFLAFPATASFAIHRRQWAASEAISLGWGGVSLIAQATGLARNTITQGVRELQERESRPDTPVSVRVRRVGAGRKRVTETDPTLLKALDALVDPVTRGHPESPLRWTCKSTRKLAAELQRQQHSVCDRTVAALLIEEGYSLQANRKTTEGKQHPDRNAQFEYVHERILAFLKKRQPIVSIDTKKKELVGEFKNGGQEWQPQGKPEKVKVHDFPDKDLGKVAPYGQGFQGVR